LRGSTSAFPSHLHSSWPSAISALRKKGPRQSHACTSHFESHHPPRLPPLRKTRRGRRSLDRSAAARVLAFEMWNSGHGTLNMELLVRRSCVAWLRLGGWIHTREQACRQHGTSVPCRRSGGYGLDLLTASARGQGLATPSSRVNAPAPGRPRGGRGACAWTPIAVYA